MSRLTRALSAAITALHRDPRCTECGHPVRTGQSAHVDTDPTPWTYTHLTADHCPNARRPTGDTVIDNPSVWTALYFEHPRPRPDAGPDLEHGTIPKTVRRLHAILAAPSTQQPGLIRELIADLNQPRIDRERRITADASARIRAREAAETAGTR